jgi:hypothetical protein
MSAPDPVDIILAARDYDVDLPYDEIDELLQQLIPGITTVEIGRAYIEAGRRMMSQGKATLQLAVDDAEMAGQVRDVLALLERLERPRGAERWIFEDATERLTRLADELDERV